jgi:hypothetical protein
LSLIFSGVAILHVASMEDWSAVGAQTEISEFDKGHPNQKRGPLEYDNDATIHCFFEPLPPADALSPENRHDQ